MSKAISTTAVIASLTSLRELDLTNNKLTEPLDVSRMPNLTSLMVGSNRLVSFIEGTFTLVHLQHVDFSNNSLVCITLSSLGALVGLRSLNLSHNQLTSLPASIDSLVSIQHLDISNNQLYELPMHSFMMLTNLQSLDCSSNRILEINDNIGKVVSLRTLVCDSNRISQLPLALATLPLLHTLSAAKCDLKELPANIGDAAALRSLLLSGNMLLTELPESFYRLTNLEQLELHGSGIVQLHPDFLNLASLQRLSVGTVQIVGTLVHVTSRY